MWGIYHSRRDIKWLVLMIGNSSQGAVAHESMLGQHPAMNWGRGRGCMHEPIVSNNYKVTKCREVHGSLKLPQERCFGFELQVQQFGAWRGCVKDRAIGSKGNVTLERTLGWHLVLPRKRVHR